MNGDADITTLLQIAHRYRDRLFVFGALSYIVAFLTEQFKKTRLIVKRGSEFEMYLLSCRSIVAGYKPPIWCFLPTFNTLMGVFIPKCISHAYEREVIRFDDGGLLALDWLIPDGSVNCICLILTGINGSSRANYVSHMVDELKLAKFKAVVMNYRGIGVPLFTEKTYCATDTSDLAKVLLHITRRYPDQRVLLAGVSLGGLIISNFLSSQHPLKHTIDAAFIVSSPFNMSESLAELEKPANYFLFNHCIVRQLVNRLKQNKNIDVAALDKISGYREFDKTFTCKIYGYESIEEYYRKSSIDTKIQDIQTPTLYLNAADDMFSPYRCFPIQSIKHNKYVAMLVTPRGGHNGFVESLNPSACTYVCRVFRDFLNLIDTEQLPMKEMRELQLEDGWSNNGPVEECDWRAKGIH